MWIHTKDGLINMASVKSVTFFRLPQDLHSIKEPDKWNWFVNIGDVTSLGPYTEKEAKEKMAEIKNILLHYNHTVLMVE